MNSIDGRLLLKDLQSIERMAHLLLSEVEKLDNVEREFIIEVVNAKIAIKKAHLLLRAKE